MNTPINIPTNTMELRSLLLRQMQRVLAGEAGQIETKAVCNLAQQVHNTLMAELRYAVVCRRSGDKMPDCVPFGPSQLQLEHDDGAKQ